MAVTEINKMMIDWFKKNLFNLLLLCLVIGYYYSSYALLENQQFHSFFETDEAVYAWQSNLIQSDFSSITSTDVNEFHPFLFPFILSIGKSFFPPHISSVIAYRSVALIISLLSIFTLAMLCFRLSGKFLAIFCILGLISNPTFFTFKFYILNDVLFMLFSMAFLLALYHLHPNSSRRKHALVGMIISLSILTRWTGILLIAVTFLWYVIQPSKKLIMEGLKRFLFYPVIIVGATVALLAFNTYQNTSSIFPNLSALGNNIQPLDFYFRRLFIPLYLIFFFMPFKEMALFFVSGIVFTIYQKSKFFFILIFMIFIGITADLMLRQTNPRYVLYLQPAFLLLTGFGIEAPLRRVIKDLNRLALAKGGIIISYIFLILSYHPQIVSYFNYKTAPINHACAGNWIKENSSKNFFVFSQDPRPVRFFTNYDYASDGGNLYMCPTHKAELKDAVQKTNKPIILELNIQREKLLSDYKPFSEPL
ncbi:MAG TPA: glycosyltransferase family 39 protein, partial [Candidatus Bathyarchaeia archaeon]|nr:glycosyltransferase family 39 protein [Candidatus Bathyarchaeia archaeon]